MTTASAPGKVILLGEHAVVYGQPALAVPVTEARVTVEVTPGADAGIVLESAETGERVRLGAAPADNPLARAARLTLEALLIETPPPLRIRIRSELPIAAGLGSGAAVSIAIIRGLSQHLGAQLTPGQQSDLAYEVEKLHHGTPSGIDNTVIAYGKPVRYQPGAPPAVFSIATPFRLVIGDTGVPSPTGEAVAAVRARWREAQEHLEDLFDRIGALVERGQGALTAGEPAALGPLLDRNQELLAELGVSHPALERLIGEARSAGALGAKLAGGGMGGNMIALAPVSDEGEIAAALSRAGAVRVLATEVRG